MVNKAAQALGKLAAGKPKNFSAAERTRRADRLAAARAKRWPRKSNKPGERICEPSAGSKYAPLDGSEAGS